MNKFLRFCNFVHFFLFVSLGIFGFLGSNQTLSIIVRKLSKLKLFLILLTALISIYVSQAMPFFYGLNLRTTAGQLLFFMVGSFTFLFFDIMLNNKGKVICYLSWALILPSWVVWDFWNIPFLFWITALIYTVYLFYLSAVIFKQD